MRFCFFRFCLVLAVCIMIGRPGRAETGELRRLWTSPPEESKSWTFWYWMYGAVSKEGITADIEAMKRVGLAGAYLMPIKGVPEQPFINPSVEQLSPEWWEMVRFALEEADRVGLKIGFHICDGFALAGGPWITPELSMQKVVWNSTRVSGGKNVTEKPAPPESYKGYYKDIALFAFPAPEGEGITTDRIRPEVTTSLPDTEAAFLAEQGNDVTFRSESPCWIQYKFDQPFTCRTLRVRPSGNNFQAQRLTVQVSEDGVRFREIVRLEPPRQGWQETGVPMTHSIPETTARYFRFYYDKSGTEPGAEDLDAAKWKQSLKIKGIWLSSEARIHQYEGKNGSMWRVSPRTSEEQISPALCIDPEQLIDLSSHLNERGELNWKAPAGEWVILRMGHTSTGHTNATGGKGAGLECDKFNPEAIQLQFDSWFGKATEVAGKELAAKVIKVLHVDSWECGSQNWSPLFREEFKKRRGYDIYPYLPVMAGYAMESSEVSERILYDVRKTIAELVNDVFYTLLRKNAVANGCEFSAECVSPTMLSDGMLHFQQADIPMGEYWLQSPTHDKMNDVLDAVSGARIYGKNIVQAESFTQLRTMWNEHPAMLRSLQDRHYALGFNRLSYHVYVHNPWLDRKPGMTLDGIGLYFQRDQTWWELGRAWVEYAQRCQALLQYGKPVADIAVFTGEEFPRRAVLPDRLLPFIPGIFGEEKVNTEQKRMRNEGEPTRVMPVGVTHSANITGASDWINALRGYAYDSFNADALLRLAEVKNGHIVLPGGMSYAALIIPGKHAMQPNPEYMSLEVVKKVKELINDGATVLLSGLPEKVPGFKDYPGQDNELGRLSANVSEFNTSERNVFPMGKGKAVRLPYREETFDNLGIERDFTVWEKGKYAENIAYTHRRGDNGDIYLISNQSSEQRIVEASFRVSGRVPELWNPVTGEIGKANRWSNAEGRTNLPMVLEPQESVFVVFEEMTEERGSNRGVNHFFYKEILNIETPWKVHFDPESRGPEELVVFDRLTDWSKHSDERIRYYSGTAVYRNEFQLKPDKKTNRYFLDLGELSDLAEIKLNGIVCGIAWVAPYRIEVTDALKKGKNTLEITVANTWANRIMGDKISGKEESDSGTRTNAPYRLAEKDLVKSGLIGPVKLVGREE